MPYASHQPAGRQESSFLERKEAKELLPVWGWAVALPTIGSNMRRIALSLASLFLATAANAADLDDAFAAALEIAPSPRRVLPLDNAEETDSTLKPLLLVHLRTNRFAMVISESWNGSHGEAGYAAVAYLDRGPAGWRPVRFWYRLIEAGSWAKPFERNRFQLLTVGPMLVFAGEGQWCGQGACNRYHHLIALHPDAPIALGNIPASASWDGLGSSVDADGRTGCGGYNYTSPLAVRKNAPGVIRVTYNGWMKPGGKGQKRRSFRLTTDVSLVDAKLTMYPEPKLPNCGR
jgi:hypothetical protein